MATKETIQTIYEVVTKGTKKLKGLIKANQEYSKSAQAANKASALGAKAFGKLKSAAVAYLSVQVAKKILKQAAALGELGAKAQFVDKSFQKFAANAGKNSAEMMNSLRSATQGMISDLQLQQLAMQGMVSGVPFEKMVVAMEFVSKQATATGADVAQKMQTVMTGLARGSAQFLDDVGIQVMGSKDVINDAVDQMKEKMDIFIESTGTSAGNLAKTKVEIENIKTVIGQDLIPLTEGWQETLLFGLKAIQTAMIAFGVTGMAEQKRQAELAKLMKQEAMMRKIMKTNTQLLEKGFDIRKKTTAAAKLNVELQQVTAKLLEASAKGGDKEESLRKRALLLKKKESAIIKELNVATNNQGTKLADWLMVSRLITKELEKRKKIDFSKKTDGDDSEAKKRIKEAEWMQATLIKMRAKGDAEEKAADEQLLLDKIAIDQKELDSKAWLRMVIAQWKAEDAAKEKADKEAELAKAKKDAATAAQIMVASINKISNARMARRNLETRDEIKRINDSTMSQKKKQKEIAKLEEKTRAENKKTANVAWAATSALAFANAAASVVDMIKSFPSITPAGKLAAGAVIGATAFGLAAQVGASKPKFYNGGEIASNGRSDDSQEVRVRSNERILTPAQNREWKVMQNKTDNRQTTTHVTNTFHINGGNLDEVRATIVSALPKAIETVGRTGAVDWQKAGVATV